MTKLQFLWCWLMVFPGICSAQVNTEALFESDQKIGQVHAVKVLHDSAFGNTAYSSLHLGYRFDHRQVDRTTTVIYKHQEKTSAGALIKNVTFVHLRASKLFSQTFSRDYFLQYESDPFKLLTRRQLLGVTLRRAWDLPFLSLFVFSPGVMIDDETVISEGQSQFVRMTSYVLCQKSFYDRAMVTATTYVQPKVADMSDFRVLSEWEFKFPLTERLNYTLSAVFRFDSKPPVTVERDDFEINQGLTFQFTR